MLSDAVVGLHDGTSHLSALLRKHKPLREQGDAVEVLVLPGLMSCADVVERCHSTPYTGLPPAGVPTARRPRASSTCLIGQHGLVHVDS